MHFLAARTFYYTAIRYPANFFCSLHFITLFDGWKFNYLIFNYTGIDCAFTTLVKTQCTFPHPTAIQMLYRLRTDMATQGHRHELEQSMLERAVEEDAARERSKLEAAQAKLVGIVTATYTAHVQTIQAFQTYYFD